MGWHNHDCNPNAAATIADCGRVRIESKRRIALGEEARPPPRAPRDPPAQLRAAPAGPEAAAGAQVSISYIDPTLSVEERRAVLEEHYGFRCNCERCKTEQRKALKSRIPTQRR